MRILIFEKQGWLSWFALFGILPGVLAIMLARKSSLKSFAPYAIISGVTLVGNSYWQIELGVQEKEKYLWRIPKYSSGDKMLKATEFVNIITKKASAQMY